MAVLHIALDSGFLVNEGMRRVKKILILDNRDHRRERLHATAVSMGEFDVDAKPAIEQTDFESAGYDVALVHLGNPESHSILSGWSAPTTKLVLFSGTWKSIADSEGVTYASAKMIEDADVLKPLLRKMTGS